MPSLLPRTATGVSGLIDAARARIAAFLSRSAVNRRVLRRLSHMSDRELARNGLARRDLIEASRPETGDAIGLLLDRRARRRAARPR